MLHTFFDMFLILLRVMTARRVFSASFLDVLFLFFEMYIQIFDMLRTVYIFFLRIAHSSVGARVYGAGARAIRPIASCALYLMDTWDVFFLFRLMG